MMHDINRRMYRLLSEIGIIPHMIIRIEHMQKITLEISFIS